LARVHQEEAVVVDVVHAISISVRVTRVTFEVTVKVLLVQVRDDLAVILIIGHLIAIHVIITEITDVITIKVCLR
jgi:hypothetical protein